MLTEKNMLRKSVITGDTIPEKLGALCALFCLPVC